MHAVSVCVRVCMFCACVCPKVDLEDEVGIDEGSIAAFTSLLIAFKRLAGLGRGRFNIL